MTDLLGPRRPARTTQAEPDTRRQVTTFATTELAKGYVRTIALTQTPGLAGVVAILIASPSGTPAGRIFVFVGSAPIVASACKFALTPGVRGRRNAGRIPMSSGASILVWSHVDERGPAICFGRQTATGEYLGRPTTLTGNELPALQRAIEALLSTDHSKDIAP